MKHVSEKRLNEMDRLADMGHFPAIVNLGATVNVLLTICATWYLMPHFSLPFMPAGWIALVLAVNLSPVVLLRLTLGNTSTYPVLAEMDFFRDQHKFSDWVYLAASANMTFWILLSWSVFRLRYEMVSLLGVLAVALVATISPVLLRRIDS